MQSPVLDEMFQPPAPGLRPVPYHRKAFLGGIDRPLLTQADALHVACMTLLRVLLVMLLARFRA